MHRETSPTVSSIAGGLTTFRPPNLIEIIDSGDPDKLAEFCEDVRTLAGSALSQDETAGQEKARYLIQSRPKITITQDGPNTVINVDYGATTFHASFAGDGKVRDAAITTLIEKICMFSTSQILIALHDAEKNNG